MIIENRLDTTMAAKATSNAPWRADRLIRCPSPRGGPGIRNSATITLITATTTPTFRALNRYGSEFGSRTFMNTSNGRAA